jgi:hypothetical protein
MSCGYSLSLMESIVLAWGPGKLQCLPLLKAGGRRRLANGLESAIWTRRYSAATAIKL